MDRRQSGRAGLSDDLVARARKWAEESCMDQGLSTRISDAKTLASVARLIGGPPGGRPPAIEPAARRHAERSST
jgi:hypothetical protein